MELNLLFQKLNFHKKDKSDRATVEEVLDPKTKIILFKLINKGFINEINGSISRGKEANVFYGTSNQGDVAIKVYKTSILTFKKRRKYIEGEFRFRKLNYSSNPRKLIKMWAEKEMRNLVRLTNNEINCPKPLYLRNNVLVMEFIGENGYAAKTLKNVNLTEDQARALYLECVIMMRKMYVGCKLIHADLSEFNMLLHKNKLYFIDVSQSIEHDHPNAFEFLRSDCFNVNEFFRKNKVQTMTLKELFEFITDFNINELNIDKCLDKLKTIAAQRTLHELTVQEKSEEEIFKRIYIPQKLDEIINYERDYQKSFDEKRNLYYQANTGMKYDLSGPSKLPIILQSDLDSESSTSELSEDANSSLDYKSNSSQEQALNRKQNLDLDDFHEESTSENKDINLKPFYNAKRSRSENLSEKKVRKKAFKDEKAEKRKSKIPKYIKKRNEKKKHRNTKKN